MKGRLEQRVTGASGCLVALLIGVITAGFVAFTNTVLGGAKIDLREEWSVFHFQALIVAAPFGVLALSPVNTKATWLTAALLTALFWGLLLAVGFAQRGTGANIGLGGLMMLSPLIIIAGAFAVDFVVKRSK